MDTNALLRMFEFWEVCELAEVEMDTVETWGDLNSLLENLSSELFQRADFDNVESGRKCFETLLLRDQEYEYFTCRACLSEMYRVLLTERVSSKLELQRVPVSLRSKRPLIVGRRALTHEDYREIRESVNSFFDKLRNYYGIDVKTLEDPSHGNHVPSETIFETSEILGSFILTETMDGYIYAAAIECEAHCFLTSDTALREMARSLHQPPDDNWRQTAQELRNELGRPEDFSFPRGYGLSESLP